MCLALVLPEVEETTEADEEEQAEEVTHLDSSLESPAQEQQSWTPPQDNSEELSERDRGAQARGVIEEEEIEEEEMIFPALKKILIWASSRSWKKKC